MSSPLAIAGVSAVLRDLLNNGLVDNDITGALGGNVTVTVSPPDAIRINDPNARTQLNIFLYQVAPNAAWRNAGLPGRDDRGARVGNPPLALDLHYLITAYGREDLHAEILLGYAMHLLHETPVMDRDAIRTALSGGAVGNNVLPPAFQNLDATDLADQVEQLRISPLALNTEEMSKLWAAMQAHYRPTAAYQVSAVLIEARRPARAALPVLTRNLDVQANLLPPFPTLVSATAPNREIAVRLGETLTIRGHHLDGTTPRLLFEHARLSEPIELTPVATANPDVYTVTLPNNAQAQIDWPAGTWSLRWSVVRPGDVDARSSNLIPVLLAPRLDIGGSGAVRAPDGRVTVSLAFSPEIRPGQRATLYCGGREAPSAFIPGPTANLDFVFTGLAAGAQRLRLRIDGVDSRLVDRSATPPVFDPGQVLGIPA